MSRMSRRRGGMAPVGHSDIGWSSKYSLGQGVDFRDYHAGQHGGVLQGAALSSMGDALPSALRASAHLSGQDRALADIRSLSDQSGGKRKRSKNKSKNKSRRSRRSRGGVAPFPSPGMLLGPMDLARAGQNPHWRDIEVDAAQARAAL